MNKNKQDNFTLTIEDLKRAEKRLSGLEKGLQKDDEGKLRDVFLDKLLTGGVKHGPKRYLPSFRVAYADAEQIVKDIPHEKAFIKAKEIIISKAKQIVAATPAPTTVVHVQTPWDIPPRKPDYEIRTCWFPNCKRSFSQDVDLEMRLRMSYRGSGGGFLGMKPGLLDHMPEEFFHMCSEHMMIKYSYFSMVDAVAFRVADRSKPNIGVTAKDLRMVGLNKTDIASIISRAKQYGYQP